jgi:hypothetical protein
MDPIRDRSQFKKMLAETKQRLGMTPEATAAE